MSDTSDPTSQPGQIDGTPESDVIDDQFLDDPNNDRVDAGQAGPSDTIAAGNGNDTIFASRGSDVIDGGSGRDTYIVGPIVLGDPVVTRGEFTKDDLSGTGYPVSAGFPFVIRRFTFEVGGESIDDVIGDDDEVSPTLGGANVFNPAASITFRITELPTLGTLYINPDPSNPDPITSPDDEWSVVNVDDVDDEIPSSEFPATSELIWVLTDAESSGLTPDDRLASFRYEVETPFEDVERTADATVSITIPQTTPVADPVLAIAEASPPFLGGFPGSDPDSQSADPAYDVVFDVLFGDGALDGDEVGTSSAPENAGGGTADIGAQDQAGSQATPVFKVLTLPEFGALYIDSNPLSTLDDWEVAQVGSTFTDSDNLRWVIELNQPGGVVDVLLNGASETTFTYLATFAGIDTAPATVTIDLSNLSLPGSSVADDVLTSAVLINDENTDTVVPEGFPIGLDTDPIIHFRAFDLNGSLDGETREDIPNLGGVSLNAVPLEELVFRISSLPEAGTLVVERSVGIDSEFIPIVQTGFQLSATDKLFWAATNAEVTDLPADGQVLFNYVVIDGTGPASAPAVVRIDVLQADPVLTLVDEVPQFDPDFIETELEGQSPVFFKSIDVGVGNDATALDGGISILEPLAGDQADLGAVSGKFGPDALLYKITELPDTGSLWIDASLDGLSQSGGLGQGWIRVDETNVDDLTLSPGDKLYWLADFSDFERAETSTLIGNPLDDDGVPSVDNIPISDWENPSTSSNLKITYSGRDFDGSPAQVVSLPVDENGNVLDIDSQEYQDLLESTAVEGLGSPIVKSGLGLSGQSPNIPTIPESETAGPVSDNFFYNTEAEISAGSGDLALASQTLVASLSNPVVGDTVFVSQLFEFEGEFGLVEAFLDGEQVAKIYFGYPNPFEPDADLADRLPQIIRDQVADENDIAVFRTVTPLARTGEKIKEEDGVTDRIFAGDPDSPLGGTRFDEGNGFGRFNLTEENEPDLIFDKLEFSSLNSGLIFADPALSADTSDYYLHALEVTEFEDIDSVEFTYSAQDPDGIISNPETIRIDTDPPRADPVTTNWEASYVDSDQPDGSITADGDGGSADGRIAYEKIFTVNDLLDGDGLESGPTTETIPTLGGREATLVSPAGGNAASLGGTIPSDGELIYTIESLPDFGVLLIGTDSNNSGIFANNEYEFAQVGDTFTSENQLRHVVSIADLDAEYKTEDEGGTNLRRGGFADHFNNDVSNRDLLQMAAFRSDQTVADAYVNVPEGRDIGDEFTDLAKSYVQIPNLGSSGTISVLAGEPGSDRDADGLQTIFNPPGGGARTPDRISFYEDPETGEGSSEGLIIDFGDSVSHTLVRTGTSITDLVREDTSPTLYAKVDLYLDGVEVGSLIVGSVVVDQQLKDQYEAQRLAAEASGEAFEPTVPNGVDIFAFTEVGNIESRPGSLFQISNEQLLNDGSRLGRFDTMVITNQGSASSRDPSEFDGLRIVGVRFIRGETSFSYSVTDSETGVKSATQLVTIGTESGETLAADDVRTQFPSEPAVRGPANDIAQDAIVLSVGGGLDGGLTTPESFQSADFGALDSQSSEDSLKFYIKTLPDDAKLFLDVGGDNPDDPNQWTEITEDLLFGAEDDDGSSTQLSFNTTDKIYVVVSSTEELITDEEVSNGDVVRVFNNLADDSDATEPGFRSYILAANQSDQKEDGDGFSEIFGAAISRTVDDSGNQFTSNVIAGSEGEPGVTPSTVYPEGEETEGFGSSTRVVLEFPDVVSRADFVLRSLGGDNSETFAGELGLLTLLRGDEVVGQFYFGMEDPADEGGPTDLPFIATERPPNPSASEIVDRVATLVVSEPGLSFDRAEVSTYGFANGARTQIALDNFGRPLEFVSAFNVSSVAYYRADVEFDYTVEAPDGRTEDGTVVIDPPAASEGEPIRIQVRNAEATIEGGRAVFAVETLNGPVDVDTFITLDVVDQLRYDGALQNGRADENDWSDDLAQNGDPAGNDQITVLIRAGESSGEASIRINAEGSSLIENDEFLHVTVSGITKEGGRDVIAHDDTGVLRIIEGARAFSVQDLDLVVDPTPDLDPAFLTDRSFGEVLFWRRFEVDDNANTDNADILTPETLDTVLSDDFKVSVGRDESDVRFSILDTPDWGNLYIAGDLEFEDQDGSIPRLTPGPEDAQTNGQLYYWVVSRNDALPDEFTNNPGLYQEVGGADPVFDSLEDWETQGSLRISASDETGSSVESSFSYTPATESTEAVTQIGVDGGIGDADSGLISSGATPGTSETLSIEYTGPADLIWAEIDLGDFATQSTLVGGLYEIAEVTVLKDGAVQASYLVGDSSSSGSPDFAIDFGTSSSFVDDRLDPRWIEVGESGRFVVGGFDFDEIEISSYGFSDADPFDDTLNPVEIGDVTAGFSLSSVSYLRDEDLITGQAPSVSFDYEGAVQTTVGTSVRLASTPGTVNISLSEENFVVPPEEATLETLPQGPQNTDLQDTNEPSEDTQDTPPFSPSASDPLVTFETVEVSVDDSGDGTVFKVNEGATDSVTNIQNFIAAEDTAENDKITFTTNFTSTDLVRDLDEDNVTGMFTPEGSDEEVPFGPSTQPLVLLSTLLNEGRRGTYQITSGDEDGQIGNISFSNFEEINFNILCFARGTNILTILGNKPVEMIKTGDRVWTLDNGYQRVRWHGVTRVRCVGNMTPVWFEPGVFENERPLVVSPQHRILLSGHEVELYTGEPQAFAAAKMLVDGEKIRFVSGGLVEYHHILLEQHNVLLSESLLTESYFPGEASWMLLSNYDRQLIAEMFPRIKKFGPSGYGQTCRPCLKPFEASILKETLTQKGAIQWRPEAMAGRLSNPGIRGLESSF